MSCGCHTSTPHYCIDCGEQIINGHEHCCECFSPICHKCLGPSYVGDDELDYLCSECYDDGDDYDSASGMITECGKVLIETRDHDLEFDMNPKSFIEVGGSVDVIAFSTCGCAVVAFREGMEPEGVDYNGQIVIYPEGHPDTPDFFSADLT